MTVFSHISEHPSVALWKRAALPLVAASLLAIGAVWSVGVQAQPVAPAGLESLESFVKNTKSGRAVFSQTVTSPSREGQSPKTKTSTGTFEFLRPNRFKFIYKKPFEQSIVSDGQTLWLHDVDLNQVTSRKLAQVLNGTPAAVIAAAADLKGLQADFNLTAQPEREGLQWVQAVPKSKDGQLQSIAVGFKATDKGNELSRLEILDSFGQKSVMSFSQVEVNPALTPATFQFTPPAGADVIRQ
ncbi:MAG: outer membrane lipoprotein chaperone LolA [Comamonadaceae bacterium]|nr:MAG: outer membrane lipoprotein chaperone LolA [Comamonadaceae bacterium]